MKLEVLLSVMNIKKEDLDKMNITSDCIVINQTKTENIKKYKNFKILSYNEKGLSKSRNRALENCTSDIAILCDDDVVYNENYEKIIINEFKKNKNADVIFFNIESPNRKEKENKKDGKVYFFNSLRYSSSRIAFRVNSIKEKNIKFNELFGSGSIFKNGEDTLFIVDCLKNKLKLCKSTKTIGIVYHNKSEWFDGYNEKYFYDKGVIFYNINKYFYKLLCLQYIIRHRETLEKIKFKEAYKIMIKGSKEYKKNYEKRIFNK